LIHSLLNLAIIKETKNFGLLFQMILGDVDKKALHSPIVR